MSEERPILFNGEMVRAILDGRKTQTRRVIKFKYGQHVDEDLDKPNGPMWLWQMDKYGEYHRWPCPYGQPGDTLWVRETVADVNSEMGPTLLYKDGRMVGWEDFCTEFDRDYGAGPSFHYGKYPGMKNDWTAWWSDIDLKGEGGHWTPSIHMPRWASRITLEITDVRVERIQGISGIDALAEGIESVYGKGSDITDFKELWDSINEKRGFGWDKNPWVWVINFRRLDDGEV